MKARMNDAVNRLILRVLKMIIEYDQIVRSVAGDHDPDHAGTVRKVEACLHNNDMENRPQKSCLQHCSI